MLKSCAMLPNYTCALRTIVSIEDEHFKKAMQLHPIGLQIEVIFATPSSLEHARRYELARFQVEGHILRKCAFMKAFFHTRCPFHFVTRPQISPWHIK